MKIDRLLALLTILLHNGQVTAPQLARRLGVSRRTITRDIEDLCCAGIPIVTRQGSGGGISILEGYKLDTSLLTPRELEGILAGLQGLESVGATPAEHLVQKLAGMAALGDEKQMPGGMLIDLASHYKESLSEKIGLLREAIAAHTLVSFTYYSPNGCTHRTVEPYLVLYKWAGWYLFGYCPAREGFRMFKLGRLWELAAPGPPFRPRPLPARDDLFDGGLHDATRMQILFEPAVEHLLVEAYGPDSYRPQPDGRLLLARGYTNLDYTARWVLSFGGDATVLEPDELRRYVRAQAAQILENYQSEGDI